MHVRRSVLASLTATAALLAVGAGPAVAGDHSKAPALSPPIAQGLAGPLQLAVGDHGSIYVSQSFAGLLTKFSRGGRADIASNPGGEISGVDLGRHGEVFYTSQTSTEQGVVTASALNRLRHGGSSVVSDILAYETANNVDQGVAYGFQTIAADCAAQWPVDVLGPPQYTGVVDSHPYSVAVAGRHHFVADAAANAIFDISSNGDIRTVAVLPPQPTVVTAEAAAALQLPVCTVGLTYNFEPVPTDVEIGRDGGLYVTTLPGGPEDASLGARGSVYRVSPWSGKTRKIAGGLLGATNLALGKHGEIYVSELFANRVSRIVHGAPQTLIDVASPAGLEFADGKLYLGYDVFANGSIATIDIGNGRHGQSDHHGHRDTRASRAAKSKLLRALSPWGHRS